MTNPSITIRLDYGDGALSGSSAGIPLQSEMPTPMGIGLASTGAGDTGPPRPDADFAAAIGQDSLPVPMAGLSGNLAAASAPPMPSPDMSGGMAAAWDAPPEPSQDFSGATNGFDATDDLPRPSAEPKDVAKSSGSSGKR